MKKKARIEDITMVRYIGENNMTSIKMYFNVKGEQVDMTISGFDDRKDAQKFYKELKNEARNVKTIQNKRSRK